MNYEKMNQRIICRMAKPFAVIFAAFFTSALVACSNVDKAVAGGSAEETGIYACENITVEVAARSIVLKPQEGDTLQDGAFAMEGYASRSAAWLYELDSVTFAETGVSYSDTLQRDGDKFKFTNVTLKSPYVLVRVFGKSISGYGGNVLAIADVRKTKNVNLNLLTTLKTSLWRYLAEKGVDHESLDMQAERATLDAFGIVDQFSGFESKEILENPDYVMAEAVVSTMFVNESSLIDRFTLDPAMKVLELDGTLDNLDSAMKERMKKRLANAIGANDLYSSMKHDILDSLALGEEVKSFYYQKQTYMRLLADVYMKLVGEGRCTEAREGELVEVYFDKRFFFVLACRSGGWRNEYLKVDEVSPKTGTMTDARDGRTYKTVTYNIDGKPQTWMAENLKYAYGNSHCLDNDERRCEIYGRLYTWREAMALDTSILWKMEDCMGYYRAEMEACVTETEDEHNGDTAKIDSLCGNDAEITAICEEETVESSIYARYNFRRAMELMDSVNHQGVCPEGWHVATMDDWNGLTTYITEAYNNRKAFNVSKSRFLLQTEYTDGAIGFGMQLMLTWDVVDYLVKVKVGAKQLRSLYVIYPSYATPVYKREDMFMAEPSYNWSIDSTFELSPEYGNMWSLDGFNGTTNFDYYGDFAIVEFDNYKWGEKNSPVRCVKN